NVACMAVRSSVLSCRACRVRFRLLNGPAATDIYTLSLHDALPISPCQPLSTWRPVERILGHGRAQSGCADCVPPSVRSGWGEAIARDGVVPPPVPAACPSCEPLREYACREGSASSLAPGGASGGQRVPPADQVPDERPGFFGREVVSPFDLARLVGEVAVLHLLPEPARVVSASEVVQPGLFVDSF